MPGGCVIHTPLALEDDACYARLMTGVEASVEVFMTAYKALPKAARAGFLARLLENRKTRKYLMDIAAIETRKSEKTRPFADYLAARR